MRVKLPELIERCKQSAPRRVAVAAAGDAPVLLALAEAYRNGIIQPILCGNIERIDVAARLHNINLSPFEIVETDSDHEAVAVAVSLVRKGQANLLMKGLVQTADLLRAVLNKENGLRGGTEVLSHVAVMDCPQLDRTLLLTDCAICTNPDLPTKVQIVKNAVKVAHGLGIEVPKVAPLAAVEVVNPNMPATLDAAALTLMNRRGQIQGCVIDGPLALDVALSAEAAAHKGLGTEAAEADILLFHNIEAGNATYKTFTVVGNCLAGGVVMGAAVPIVLTSRADSPESKLFSIALACASV